MEELCNASSDSVIRTILTDLPVGLGETYRRILTGISQSPSRAQLAQKMFKWAAVAKRPLNIEEFKEAAAFDPSDRSWNEDRIPHEDHMFESCRGLIIKDADDQTVRLAHHTVLQYLTTGLSTIIDPFFKISTIEAEIFAGKTCMSYLLFSDFETQLTTAQLGLGDQGVLQSGGPLKIPNILGIKAPIALPHRLFREKKHSRALQMDYSKHLNSKLSAKRNPPVALNEKYRLLQYVIDYWESHVRSFPTTTAQLDCRLGRLALEKTLAFEFRPWGPNQHYGPYGCVGCPSPSTADLVATDLPHISMLHYAAKVGNMPLLLLTEDLLLIPQRRDTFAYLDHERYHNETLLTACRHGRTEIVKHLLSIRPLEISRIPSPAPISGPSETLEYLPDVKQSWIRQRGGDMLLAAAENGCDAVIDVLVEAGVSLEATDKHTGRGVLELAAMNGHDSVVRSLFKRGARTQISSELDPNQTALSLAAMNGHAAAARALLEFDPWPLNSRALALHAAARSGHSAVAEVLLQYDTNSAVSTYSGNKYAEAAFHVAAQKGHVGILKLFKDHVQSVDSPRTTGGLTALHVAAKTGQVEVVRWLVDNGADVNAITPVDDTPLSFATNVGDEIIVRVLLEHGARVLVTRMEEVLADATMLGETTILELLLENVRGDQKTFNSIKGSAIYDALRLTRSEQKPVAVALLERELELLSQE